MFGYLKLKLLIKWSIIVAYIVHATLITKETGTLYPEAVLARSIKLKVDNCSWVLAFI